MGRPPSDRPTDFELEVLKILWATGPTTVRDVHDAMSRRREVGLTTVLKMLQVMRDKGLLACDADVRPQLWRAAVDERETLGRFAGDLLERVFDGSAGLLLQHALSGRRCSREELAAIRRLIDEREQANRRKGGRK